MADTAYVTEEQLLARPRLEAASGAWRDSFRAALRLCDTPEKFSVEILSGLKARAWVNLKAKSGRRFRTFEDFCTEPQPWGLGTPSDQVKEFLRCLQGVKEVKLLAVPPSQQGERTDLLAGTSRPEGEKSGRQDQRLRAIHRAGEPIVTLYKNGMLTAKEAAAFGRTKIPTEQAARIEGLKIELQEFAGREPTDGDRATVKAMLEQVFPPPDLVEKLVRAYNTLSLDEQARFCRLVPIWTSVADEIDLDRIIEEEAGIIIEDEDEAGTVIEEQTGTQLH